MPVLLQVLFGFTAFAVMGLGATYVYRRLVADLTQRVALRRAGLVVFVALFAAVPLSRLASFDHARPMLRIATVSWLGVLMYVFLALLAADAVRLSLRGLLRLKDARRRRRSPPHEPGAPAGSGEARREAVPTDEQTAQSMATEAPGDVALEGPTRRQLVARATAAGALCASGLLTFRGLRTAALEPPELTVTEVPLRGLPKSLDGFTIVHLTDIHVGHVIREAFVDRLVEVAGRVKADLVAITGDLVDGSPAQLGHIVQRLTRIQARHGIAFASGNHDYYSGWERWAPVLTGMGFQVLRNRRISIGDPGGSFDLIGVDDYGSRRMSGGFDLELALDGWDSQRPSVLLAHQPQSLSAAARRHVGLQLSGHTHGGQLFPATIVGDLIWGDLNRGLSKLGDTYCYTSCGCGFVGPPMRIGAPPEVAKIVLVAR